MLHFERMQALRAIDANANRGTEALRVVEDHARFVRNHGQLAGSLKQLRHELVSALSAIPDQERLQARDTDGDVGTILRTETEFRRDDLQQVAAANWKRAEQALRSIEEFAKSHWADVARQIEQLRYRLYSLEKLARVDFNLRHQISAARLYVLCSGLDRLTDFERRIVALVEAEVDVIQLREKKRSDREVLELARVVRQCTESSNTLFIMNDRADLAVLAEADGLHVGQEELDVHEARMLIGSNQLIGVSTHSLTQAEEAERRGADYIGCGPVFPSATKSFDSLAGISWLRHVSTRLHVPAFAIGGITLENLAHVRAAGFTRIAVQHAIWEADDPARAARDLRVALET